MKRLALALSVMLITVIGASAQTTNYQAYALFVINIAKYSEFPGLQGEIHIVTLGKSKAFDELFKHNGKTVNGNTLKVTQSESIADVTKATIVYISDNRSSSLSEVMKATEGKPVMIICEREGMYRKGAGFSFIVTDNNNLRFDINNVELEKRQIKVSKNLSALANAVI